MDDLRREMRKNAWLNNKGKQLIQRHIFREADGVIDRLAKLVSLEIVGSDRNFKHISYSLSLFFVSILL